MKTLSRVTLLFTNSKMQITLVELSPHLRRGQLEFCNLFGTWIFQSTSCSTSQEPEMDSLDNHVFVVTFARSVV